MHIRPIRSDDDLLLALRRLSALMGCAPGTPESDEFDVLSVLVEHYEGLHHPVEPADPRQVIRFKMHELGLSGRELARKAGIPPARVSELLNGKRAPTLSLLHSIAGALAIPVTLLVGRASLEAKDIAELPTELEAETGEAIRRAADAQAMSMDAYVTALLAGRSDVCVTANRSSFTGTGSHQELIA